MEYLITYEDRLGDCHGQYVVASCYESARRYAASIAQALGNGRYSVIIPTR